MTRDRKKDWTKNTDIRLAEIRGRLLRIEKSTAYTAMWHRHAIELLAENENLKIELEKQKKTNLELVQLRMDCAGIENLLDNIELLKRCGYGVAVEDSPFVPENISVALSDGKGTEDVEDSVVTNCKIQTDETKDDDND